MTRLLRVIDGKREEVSTSDRMAGLYDALLLAQKEGDGQYIYDYQNGTYHELEVVEGKVQPFDSESIKYGEPARELDNEDHQQTISDGVSLFGGVFSEGDGVGAPVDRSTPAVEEF